MFRLRRCILSHLLSSPSSPSTPSISSLHRLLSATASVPPNPFDVKEYLVTTCGLTRPQALKASKKLSHLKSPSKPDAVVAFLSDLGVSRSGIAGVVAADPQLLCADVEKNLAKRVVELTELRLTRSQIARLLRHARVAFRTSSIGPNLRFWLPIFGSFQKILKCIKISSGILASDLEKVTKPNLAFLQQYGISAYDFTTYSYMSLVLCRSPKHVQEAVMQISMFGVPQNSKMFRHALMSFAVQTPEKLADKIGILEMFGWSKDDLSISVRKLPCIFNMSEERLRRNLHFLIRDAGLGVPYVAKRPALMMYSLERRLLPRHCLFKALKEKGLLDVNLDFFSAVLLNEKKFLDRFVRPFEGSIPLLASTYASSCSGKFPNGFTI